MFIKTFTNLAAVISDNNERIIEEEMSILFGVTIALLMIILILLITFMFIRSKKS